MTLVNGQIGKKYIIDGIEVKETIQKRLGALGLIGGTPIEVLNNKKSGAIIFKVRGTRLAVGKKIAEGIRVREAEV